MGPFRIAPGSPGIRRRRLRRVAVEPLVDGVVIELLRPEKPGIRLARDRTFVRRRGFGNQSRVEPIGLTHSGGERPLEFATERIGRATVRAS